MTKLSRSCMGSVHATSRPQSGCSCSSDSMSPSITRPGLQQLFSHHIELSKLIKYAPTAPALGLVSMMLHYVIVKTVVLVGLIGCTRQAALERQDLSCKYLAHHELESVLIIIINIIITNSCSLHHIT